MIARLSLTLGICLLGMNAASEPQPRIAIIIDDLGYQLEAGNRSINLPGPVACAILPATPRAAKLAEAAFANGKDVLLHLPLEPVASDSQSDPGSLMLDMSREQFGDTFLANLNSVPHAIGVNSHRGSMLTQHPGHMGWLMEELRMRGDLIFVDSYTTHKSVSSTACVVASVSPVSSAAASPPDTRKKAQTR